MAKTMQEWAEAKLSKEFYDGAWRFRGTQFIHRMSLEGKACIVYVTFSCGYGWVKANVGSEYYGIPDSVRMFTGQTAAEECIRWSAYKVCEADEIVANRTQPYVAAHEKYLKALRGE